MQNPFSRIFQSRIARPVVKWFRSSKRVQPERPISSEEFFAAFTAMMNNPEQASHYRKSLLGFVFPIEGAAACSISPGDIASGNFSCGSFGFTGGNVGIGTGSPGYPLHIVDGSAVISGNGFASLVQETASPGGASSANYAGAVVQGITSSGNAFSGTLYGISPQVYHQGSSSLSKAYAVGIWMQNSGGALTDVHGVDVQGVVDSGKTITNYVGIYVHDAGNSGGTITNNYGIKIDAQTGGSSNYAIYSAGGNNYFGGNVGIGTSSPSQALSVVGNATLSGFAGIAGSTINDNDAVGYVLCKADKLLTDKNNEMRGYQATMRYARTTEDASNLYGIVNTSSTSVTWVSGSQFRTGGFWNGLRIDINGVSYVISSVTDATHLTLTASAGTQSGVESIVWGSSATSTESGLGWDVFGYGGAVSVQEMDLPNIGNVDTSGSSVTWVSGTKFSWVSAGQHININGADYVIASVSSTTSLTLQTNAGTQNNVPYADVNIRGQMKPFQSEIYFNAKAPGGKNYHVEETALNYVASLSAVDTSCSVKSWVGVFIDSPCSDCGSTNAVETGYGIWIGNLDESTHTLVSANAAAMKIDGYNEYGRIQWTGCGVYCPSSGILELQGTSVQTASGVPFNVGGSGGNAVCNAGGFRVGGAATNGNYLRGNGSSFISSGLQTSDFGSISANQVLAAPNGSSGTPTFRSLVAADTPNLPATKITSGAFASSLFGNGIDTSAGIDAGSYSLQGTEIIYLSGGNPTIGITGVGNFGSVEVGSGTVITASRQVIIKFYSGVSFPSLADHEVAFWWDESDFWLVGHDSGNKWKVQMTAG